MIGKLKLLVINISCGELYENTFRKICSGPSSMWCFPRKHSKTIYYREVFSLLVYHLCTETRPIQKSRCSGDSDVYKIKVSRFQIEPLLLSLVMTAGKSYLIFFIFFFFNYIFIYKSRWVWRETLKVIYLGSRRTGTIFAKLYVKLITPDRKLNTVIKLLYPKNADRMNTDIILQLRGPIPVWMSNIPVYIEYFGILVCF